MTQPSTTAAEGVTLLASKAKVASRALRLASTDLKNNALMAIADALDSSQERILTANAKDVTAAQSRLSAGMLDRLTLTADRIADISSAVRYVATLPDPVGHVVRGRTLSNGLELVQKRVPMGVVGMIYEARPNVTVDAAVLALKAGSAVVLRGGSAALNSNRELVAVMREAIASQNLPADLIATVDDFGREGAVELMRARGLVDVVIPRGGAGLISTVVRESLVPVIETGTGNCHVYIDSAADLTKALPIVMNSKTHRVGVCNAAETLLLHADVLPDFGAQVLGALADAGVTIHADERALPYAPNAVVATEEDWATEYLALDIAVRVVDSVDEAIEHISRYSSGHTEAIVSENVSAVKTFTQAIDSAVVMVNSSTRFTDGGMFGLGAEIGISTQKLHARGPMGLEELTTTTWIVTGDGHVRN